MNDIVVEPLRATLIPGFNELKKCAKNSGALACHISGAGPSIFALCENSLKAEEVGECMQRIYRDTKIESDLFISGINQEGAIKY